MELTMALLLPIYPLILLFTFISSSVSMLKNRYKFKRESVKIIFICSEVLFTIIAPAFGFYRFDEFGTEIPFARQHFLIIVLLVFTSSVFYWVSKITFHFANPIIRILLSVGLLQGIILSGIITLHFSKHMMLGLVFPFMGFELLAPLMSFFLFLRQYFFYSKMELDLEEILPYRIELGLIPWPYKIMLMNGLSKIIVYFLLVVIAIGIQMSVGCLFGLDLDAIIKAFTHSNGFLFSRF